MCVLKNLRMRKLKAKVYNYYRKTFNGRDKMTVGKLNENAKRWKTHMYYD